MAITLPLPNELRFINQFLQRSRELATHEPIIAYYCQFYAVKLALGKGSPSADAQGFLLQLVEDLEMKKEALGQEAAITDDATGQAYLTTFAMQIFTSADNDDRAGRASKQTALNFLAASTFLELLRVFGELEPQVEEKLKYAKWKAKDIVQALKEGQVPTPGPPGGLTKAVEPPSPNPPTVDADAFPSPPSLSPLPPPGRTPVVGKCSNQPPLTSQSITWSDSADDSDLDYSAVDVTMIDSDVVMTAEKHARFALSALQFEDIPTAVQNLQEALDILLPFTTKS
ncbi:hypothetical protein IWQ62_000043 [Dispira parvispora]|uniref:Vacuolar protein sorting-associated protein VTA1 n=1 Tax=Dispira parvispora TaxID=1520584 RepID=A0A9W8AXN2_9FUNG|nr:hypothetical protein IWQ62_000043 [Dispira parvispora]